MMNKRAPRRSNEEWHQIILAARASGLSDVEYCRNNSIPSSTFYRALARLRQQACELPARSERLECKQEGEKKKKASYKELYDKLPARDILCHLDLDAKICPQCGSTMERVGREKVRTELKVIPAQMKRRARYSKKMVVRLSRNPTCGFTVQRISMVCRRSCSMNTILHGQERYRRTSTSRSAASTSWQMSIRDTIICRRASSDVAAWHISGVSSMTQYRQRTARVVSPSHLQQRS